MTDLRQIDQFLAGCLRAIRDGEPAGWHGLAVDRRTIWRRIEYHGIAVLLHRHASLLENWPGELLDRIGEEARLTTLWEATHGRATGKLVASLAAQKIESIVMKGSAFAYWLHDDPATRRRGDTDLLVRPEDLDRTREILARTGWTRREDVHGIRYQEGWLFDEAIGFVHVVDLHWAPVDSHVLQDLLSLEDCFEHGASLPRLCAEAQRPDAAFLMLHAIVNQIWHERHGYLAEEGRVTGARRLIWSVDFVLLLEAMNEADWKRLLLLCGQGGAGSIVAQTLRSAARDLGAALPDEPLARLEAQPANGRLSRYLATEDELSGFMLDLGAAPGWRERTRLLASRAFAPRAHLVEKYPDRSGWPTWLLRSRLVAGTLLRLFRRAVRV